MTHSFHGVPLARPPAELPTLDFLTQASPVDESQVEVVLDPKDLEIERLNAEVARLMAENTMLWRLVAGRTDSSGVA